MRAMLVCSFFSLAISLPTLAAPDPKKPPLEDDAADIADKLLERIDLDRYERVYLRTALDVLQEKIGCSILLDYKGLLNGRLDEPDAAKSLDERPISMPAMKKVRIETVIRQILDQIDASYLVFPDHISVTSAAIKDHVSGPARVLRELNEPGIQDEQLERSFTIRHTGNVTVRFRDMPLGEALKNLAMRTGRSIAVAADAGESKSTAITASFANTPFESAVATLAEAAGLRAFRTGNSVVVVSAARAKAIESPLETNRGFGGLDVGLSNGRTFTLEELEAIARLFPGAKLIEPSTSKADAAKKDAETQKNSVARLEAEKAELEAKIKKLTEDLEKARK